mmetsp:Transcript_20078/g.17777  ORF Transcript_20078/g.17777 Transcript_20078/m.17777 type:complete len:110 (+) Transcript_20078:308-637(+)
MQRLSLLTSSRSINKSHSSNAEKLQLKYNEQSHSLNKEEEKMERTEQYDQMVDTFNGVQGEKEQDKDQDKFEATMRMVSMEIKLGHFDEVNKRLSANLEVTEEENNEEF